MLRFCPGQMCGRNLGPGADMRWWNYQNSLYGPILQFYGFKLDDLLKVWIHYGNRQCALLWVRPPAVPYTQKTFIQSRKRQLGKCKLQAAASGLSWASPLAELVTWVVRVVVVVKVVLVVRVVWVVWGVRVLTDQHVIFDILKPPAFWN